MKSKKVDNKHSNHQSAKGYQLKQLFKQIFMPHLFWALGALIFLLVTVLITLSLPIMVRYIVDGYVFNIETGQKYLFISCVLVTVAAFGTAIRFYLVTLLGERLVSNLRQELFEKIINLSPSFFEKNLTGDLVSRINADTIPKRCGIYFISCYQKYIAVFREILMFSTSIKLPLSHYSADSFLLYFGRFLRKLAVDTR